MATRRNGSTYSNLNSWKKFVDFPMWFKFVGKFVESTNLNSWIFNEFKFVEIFLLNSNLNSWKNS